jgi:hypothetical protein
MAVHPWVPAFLSRAFSVKPRPASGAREPGRSANWPLAEALEDRIVLASASVVEDVLLPKFIAQAGDSNNQLPASDAWWALRSQRNMAIDEPISKVMNLGGHNAFNSLNEGYDIVREFAPNQILSLTGQLDLGARLIELDIHDPRELNLDLTRNLILKHGPGPYSFTRLFPFYVNEALAEVQAWLARPDNRNEIIFLDIEDATEQAENGADDPLIPKLQSFLGPLIYTPAERAADGAWPSRSELLSRNDRVVLFTHRNDDQHGRFGVPQRYVDPNGHAWYGASLAFRANGGDDPVADRGNFDQVKVDDFGTAPSEDADSFFAVQSDGIVIPGSASKATAADVAKAARLNVDFLKMDFLFADDEDADLGSNVLPVFDPFYDIPEGNRVELLDSAVWSWARNDPAVDRQMFQDLIPGDGTGDSLLNFVANRAGPSIAQNLASAGASARGNGRDVAVQNTSGRWESVAPVSSTPMRFAARSVTANAAGEYDWALTTGASTRWADGYQIVLAEFGSGFIFAAPVNGFQNAALAAGNAAEPVWMNVHDFDRDGNWQVGNCAPRITSVHVQPGATSEGARVELTIEFADDAEGHELRIDWGNGAPATVLQLAAQQSHRVVVPYTYKDDGPQTGTAADDFDIRVTVTDAGGLSDQETIRVTVRNVAPVIAGFASNATFDDTAAEGKPVGIRASFSDAGVSDTHAAVVDWGDGSAPQVVTVHQGAGVGTITGSHAYAAGGVYKITLTLTDDDTGSATITGSAVVTGVGLHNGILYVIGGSDDDHVGIKRAKGKLEVKADFIPGKSRAFDAAAVHSIISYLGAGNDHLDISKEATMPAVIHGGRGDDHLASGGGAAALLGDEGDDQLVGQTGSNILIGGPGRDALVAARGGDVLIGGSTNADKDDHTLMAAAVAWASPAPYTLRASSIDALFVVTDDGNRDGLTGGSGQDLFYDGADDRLKGSKRDELILA